MLSKWSAGLYQAQNKDKPVSRRTDRLLPPTSTRFRRRFFVVQHFESCPAAAAALIKLIAQSVFDDPDTFSPKHKPEYDMYPTITTKDPTSKKKRAISEDDYMVGFRENWAWACLAKHVAYYTNYKFQQSFMTKFNDPSYQVSTGLDLLCRALADFIAPHA